MNERTKVIFPTFKFHRYSFKYLILDFKFSKISHISFNLFIVNSLKQHFYFFKKYRLTPLIFRDCINLHFELIILLI